MSMAEGSTGAAKLPHGYSGVAVAVGVAVAASVGGGVAVGGMGTNAVALGPASGLAVTITP
jgi:hypothetical protein